jgi:hypothetical protein
VRPGLHWKLLFKGSGGGCGAMSKARSQEYEDVQNADVQNARRVIEACRENIVVLWNHPAVHTGLADQIRAFRSTFNQDCAWQVDFFFSLPLRSPAGCRSFI